MSEINKLEMTSTNHFFRFFSNKVIRLKIDYMLAPEFRFLTIIELNSGASI